MNFEAILAQATAAAILAVLVAPFVWWARSRRERRRLAEAEQQRQSEAAQKAEHEAWLRDPTAGLRRRWEREEEADPGRRG